MTAKSERIFDKEKILIKENKMKRLTILLAAFFLLPCALKAQTRKGVFTPKQAQYIACAKEKLRILYIFLDPSQTPESKKIKTNVCTGKEVEVSPPKWLLEDLPSMHGRMLWSLENAGRKEYLSETEMWRRAIFAVLDVLSQAERINEGSTDTEQKIIEDFGRTRTFFLMDLDRINAALPNYNMKDGMRGRSRSLAATLKLINSEMYSVSESFISPAGQWKNKFRQSVIGIAVLSGNMYNDITKSPQSLMPWEAGKSSSNRVLISVLMAFGAFAVFFSVYKIVSDKNDEINDAFAKYMQKSSAWADDYSRQFININVKYLVLGTLGFFSIVGLFFGSMVGGLLGALMFAICFAMGLYAGLKMPGLMLGMLKRRRGEKINGQLMDALILLSNSLKSGMDIVQGFDMVSHDLRPPISEEFALVIKNYQLGTPFEVALEGMEERVESRLLSYMVKAIVLQRQVGGNLTKIFERIVENIREESKLEDKLQAMTAQQRIQALVVGIMPWIMVGVMFVFQPDTMLAFYNPTNPVGMIVLFFCIIWIGLGIKMVNKLGEIKV
jgi:tight adherence protein B